MCGIVGYIGKNYSRSYVVEGLSRLEYRGYDSAGFACLEASSGSLKYAKSQGDLLNLVNQLKQTPIDGFVGMGHVRWSTHGVTSLDNAHPHMDCHKKISVVHNGIIENYHQLKIELELRGHRLQSQTDTELVAHLLESLLVESDNLKAACTALVNRLQGANAFCILMQDYPDTILVIRRRSPLCIGVGEGEMFIASDQLALAGYTNNVLFLPEETFALIKKDFLELYDFQGRSIPYSPQTISQVWDASGKQQYEHFMLKEILEQKKVIQDMVAAYRALGKQIWTQLNLSSERITSVKTIYFIACGTSYHAARIAQFFIESIAGIQVQASIASEFRHMPFFTDVHTLFIAISQSGETADVLDCLRFLRKHHMPIVTLTNTSSSTMVRETDGYMLAHAGPEIAVASTKAFSAQLAALYLLANALGSARGTISIEQAEKAEQDLLVAAEVLENSIEHYKQLISTKLAPYYAQFKHAIFLGRQISLPLALEASLKLKEISYIFTDCYPAGELKHGSLALVDSQTPVFLFSVLDPHVYQKIVSSAQEVKARSGHLVVFAFEGQHELIEIADFAFVLPKVSPLLAPLSMIGLVQFFVYHIAKVLGRPIDKPRNLAKSVTVE